jgi:RNA polymerase sigma factor (sigma-70 family)
VFFRREFPRIARSLALIAGDPLTGADLAQESFARALERWGSYSSEEHARRSILRIGTNRARSNWRKERRVTSASLDPAVGSEAGGGIDVADRLAIRNALAALSPRQRACVTLVDYLGLEPSEVGTILRIPASTVRVHLTRGRRNLLPVLKGIRTEEGEA